MEMEAERGDIVFAEIIKVVIRVGSMVRLVEQGHHGVGP